MSEYISKQEINRVLLNRIDMNNKCLSGARESEHFEEEKYFSTLIFEDEQIKALIEESAPSADVRPNIHARWIELPKAFNPNELPCKCSNPKCGEILSFMNGYPKSKFCPSCGAIMDGEPKVTAKVGIVGKPSLLTHIPIGEKGGHNGR